MFFLFVFIFMDSNTLKLRKIINIYVIFLIIIVLKLYDQLGQMNYLRLFLVLKK